MNRLNQTEQEITLTDFIPDGIDIKKIVKELYQYIYYILGSALVAGIIAFLYTFTLVPQYQTTAMLRLNLSQGSSLGLMNKFGFHPNNNSTIDVQEALIHTRYILEPVISKNAMNVSVSPNYFPIFGAWYARHSSSGKLSKPLWGLDHYAWGGEIIEVKKFNVDSVFENISFQLLAGNKGTFKLYNQNGDFILEGKVGKEYSNKALNIRIELSKLTARPGTKFTILESSPLNLIARLSRMIQISNVYGNDPTQNTGIFQIQLSDSDPVRVKKILNSIIDCVVDKNIKDKTLENQRSLDFLNKRLPEIKQSLSKAEDEINQYHIKNNTLSMTMISQMLTKELNMLQMSIGQLKTQHKELLQEYTDQHPLVIASINKEKELEDRLIKVKEEIRRFPLTFQKEINLQREVKIKNVMYLSMLAEREQLQVANSRFASDITVLSDAMPVRKVESNKLLITLFGFLFGGFLTSVIILAKSAIRAKAIESAEQIESTFNVSVKAILPFSKHQKELNKINVSSTLGSGISAPLILAKQEPNDLIIESLRSLRISLQLMDSLETSSIITITGSSPGVGKSFVSLNLAQVLADSGQRTLIIDADIRKGQLHRALQQSRTNGLSEYLENKCTLDSIIRPIEGNLYFLPCGKYTDHPSLLLQNNVFKGLFSQLKDMFDKIIIDTPPVLPVLDSILISQYGDIRLFVASVGKDTLSDLKEALKKFKSHNIELNGVILNHTSSSVHYGANKYLNYSYGVQA